MNGRSRLTSKLLVERDWDIYNNTLFEKLCLRESIRARLMILVQQGISIVRHVLKNHVSHIYMCVCVFMCVEVRV
jgi:hypothetical protein